MLVLQRSASIAVWPWWCASPGRTQPGACLGALYTVHSMHRSLLLVGWDGHSPGSPPYCVWGVPGFCGMEQTGVLHGMSEQPPLVSRRSGLLCGQAVSCSMYAVVCHLMRAQRMPAHCAWYALRSIVAQLHPRQLCPSPLRHILSGKAGTAAGRKHDDPARGCSG